MFDLLRNRIFGALYFSPKFLITCQIVILVRFQMIQTSIFGADSLIWLVFEDVWLIQFQTNRPHQKRHLRVLWMVFKVMLSKWKARTSISKYRQKRIKKNTPRIQSLEFIFWRNSCFDFTLCLYSFRATAHVWTPKF